MLLRELEAGFRWGVLLVTDERATDEIPGWTSNEERVTSSPTAAVVRVRHRDEGDVIVQVWDDGRAVRGGLAFSGVLDLGSGVLKVSDAPGDYILRVPVGIGPASLEVYTDAAVEATHVDLVVALEPPGRWYDALIRDHRFQGAFRNTRAAQRPRTDEAPGGRCAVAWPRRLLSSAVLSESMVVHSGSSKPKGESVYAKAVCTYLRPRHARSCGHPHGSWRGFL